MSARLTVDEVLLAAFAIAVFVAVQLGDASGGDPPELTATPTSFAATSPATPSPVATHEVGETATPPATVPPRTTTAATPAPDPDSCDFRDELERVRGAVVRIRSPESPYSGSQGTGFHIGGGQFVTAAHVVQDEQGRAYDDIYVETALTGGRQIAEVVRAGSFSTTGTRQHRDIAILRSALVIEHSLVPRTPGDGDVGRDVRALGYAWSQADDESINILPPVVVRGVLSSTAIRDNIAVVQADVQAQSGMSGGPLVDECGFVLAVASAVPLAPGGEVGDGLAVFISTAELDKLR